MIVQLLKKVTFCDNKQQEKYVFSKVFENLPFVPTVGTHFPLENFLVESVSYNSYTESVFCWGASEFILDGCVSEKDFIDRETALGWSYIMGG